MIVVPVPDRPGDRVRRIAVRAVLVVCGLVFVANVVMSIAALTSSEKIEPGKAHTLKRGSVVLLTTTSAWGAECTVTGDGAPDRILVRASTYLPVRGKVVGRASAGPVRLTCDSPATVSSGLVPYLYPLADDQFWLALLASLVIGYRRWQRTRSLGAPGRLWQQARFVLSRRRRPFR